MRRSSSTSDAAWVRAMLDVEAALARVHGADAVAAACVADDWDAEAILAAGEAHATPVVPLVEELRARVADPDVVHVGATSQDVLDTAAMLVVARTLPGVLADARAAADACARLADVHRGTPVMARTLLQQAQPTSFGLKAAGWLHGIDVAAAALRRVELPVQLAGPVGVGDPALTAAVADALQAAADPAPPAATPRLVARALPWQADRTPVAQLAAAFGVLAGELAKPCRDVVLLAQTEVGAVQEAAAGQSSAMPHKRNPAQAVQALAAAHRVPGLVSTLLAGMTGEHERAAGVWQAERVTLSRLLDDVADTARFAAASLGGLQVQLDPGEVPAHATTYIDRALAAHEEAWA